jgi:hypothetical protein
MTSESGDDRFPGTGTHGRRGLRHFAPGSDAETVARNASVPVLLCRSGAAKPAAVRDRSAA